MFSHFMKLLIIRKRIRRRFVYSLTLSAIIFYIFTLNFITVKTRLNTLLKPYYQVDYPEYTYIQKSPKNLSKVCNPLNENYEDIKISIDNDTYPKIEPLFYNKSINFTCLNLNTNRKTILLWNTFTGLPIIPIDPKESSELLYKSNCPVTNCDFTSDRSKLGSSDMILFHMRSRIDKFPEFRYSSQRWVYLIYESQQHCPMCSKLDNLFNLSATFSSTSDITSVYLSESKLKWTKQNQNFNDSDYLLEEKKGFAVILISDCSENLNRLQIVKALRKYISIDIYGKCSDQGLKCPKDQNCREYLAKKYKFFLAFENSFCNEYITEKFFNTLQYNVIPVVLGGGDYSKYVPKSAFINIIEYRNLEELAKYMIYLSSNQTAYSEFFNWKKFIEFDKIDRSFTHYCEMCIKLQLEEFIGIQHKIFENHSKFFKMENNCNGIKLENINGKKFVKLVTSPEYLKMRYLESY